MLIKLDRTVCNKIANLEDEESVHVHVHYYHHHHQLTDHTA